MSCLHICNTFFEKELEAPSTHSLSEWMRSHPIVQQLHRLPQLYSGIGDKIFDGSEISEKIARIEDWGASLAIAAWAKERSIQYIIPDWRIVRTVNSKIFSFSNAPQLPGAALLDN